MWLARFVAFSVLALFVLVLGLAAFGALGRISPLFATEARQSQPLSTDTNLLQGSQQIAAHPFRKVDGTVVLVYLDAADVLTVEDRFVADGTHKIARFHTVRTSYLSPKTLHTSLRLW